jgi:hypothetical protein
MKSLPMILLLFALIPVSALRAAEDGNAPPGDSSSDTWDHTQESAKEWWQRSREGAGKAWSDTKERVESLWNMKRLLIASALSGLIQVAPRPPTA